MKQTEERYLDKRICVFNFDEQLKNYLILLIIMCMVVLKAILGDSKLQWEFATNLQTFDTEGSVCLHSLNLRSLLTNSMYFAISVA